MSTGNYFQPAKERWCPTGNHFRPMAAFRLKGGKRARDCARCEVAREAHANRVREGDREFHELFEGVDIDRIHYKLGAVTKRTA